MSMPAHTKYILLSILFILASVNFTRTALEIIENSKRLDELSQEVQGLEDQKVALEESVSYKKTDEYVEEKARNDLSLIRPGEKVYVIPKEIKNLDLESQVLGAKSGLQGFADGSDGSNLSRWIALFVR